MQANCNICGDTILESDLVAVDDDGAPCHEWCLEDLRNQDQEEEDLRNQEEEDEE